MNMYDDDMLLCMRTTIEINDELMRQAKKKAAVDGSSLRAVVEAALRSHLGGPRARRFKLRWSPETGTLLAGVRVEDRRSLEEAMEPAATTRSRLGLP